MALPRLSHFKGTSLALGALGEIALDFGGSSTSKVRYEIARVKIRRVSGAAANFTPLIVEETGSVASDIESVWTGAATAVGALHDSSPSGKYGLTGDDGKAYLIPGWDAGADNVCEYEVFALIW